MKIASIFKRREPDKGSQTEPTFTQDTQALKRAEYGIPMGFSGSGKLITVNMQALADYYTKQGVKVRAWSFFSGPIANAEMMYQASHGPEDILALSELPSFRSFHNEQMNKLQTHKIHNPSDPGSRETVKAKRLHVVHLVDHCPALFKSLKAQGLQQESTYAVGWSRSAAIHFYGGFPLNSLSMDMSNIDVFELEEFEGTRAIAY